MILIVDDEEAIIEMASRMLEMHGYIVLKANTPAEAIRLAEEHTIGIRLLVTDVVMPDMNGRDLAANLMATLPHLKCVFMSGYTADVELDPTSHRLDKPFTMAKLVGKVREALEHKGE